MPGFDPSIPPICPNCDIPIYPGSDHVDQDACFVSLKAFVKLCQDEIEESRMRDFKHPTREELIKAMLEMEDQFNKLATYEEALVKHIHDLLRGTV